LEALFLPCPQVECIGKGKASRLTSSASKPRSPPPMPAPPAESRTLQLVASHWGEDWHFIVGADRFPTRLMSVVGTFRKCRDVCSMVAIGGKAGVTRTVHFGSD
jgi:hypothetical protein